MTSEVQRAREIGAAQRVWRRLTGRTRFNDPEVYTVHIQLSRHEPPATRKWRIQLAMFKHPDPHALYRVYFVKEKGWDGDDE